MIPFNNPIALEQIRKLSVWAGEPARDLVILAEGNASIKVGPRMLVKSSGASLADGKDADYVEVDRARLEALIENGTASDDDVAKELTNATTWGSRRPSVETLLHIVCQSYEEISAVLHTHPTDVNALLCSTAAEQLVAGSYFPDQIVTLGVNPLLIPYIDPGLPLAHAAQRIVREHVASTGSLPKVIYLQNHGMFALGGSVAEAMQITQMAVKTARIILGANAVGGPRQLTTDYVDRIHTRPDELLRRSELRER